MTEHIDQTDRIEQIVRDAFAPTRHPDRTDDCPNLARFAEAHPNRWTVDEGKHVRTCPFCQKVGRMFDEEAEADDDPGTVADASTAYDEETSFGSSEDTSFGSSEEAGESWAEWRAKFEPWVERILSRDGIDPQRADEFLDSLETTFGALGSVGLRRMAVSRFDAFRSKNRPGGAEPLAVGVIEAVAVAFVLERSTTDDPGIAAFHEKLAQRNLAGPGDLLRVDVSDADIPSSYIDTLFFEANDKKNEGLDLFALGSGGSTR